MYAIDQENGSTFWTASRKTAASSPSTGTFFATETDQHVVAGTGVFEGV